jgi:hypothetical protein
LANTSQAMAAALDVGVSAAMEATAATMTVMAI